MKQINKKETMGIDIKYCEWLANNYLDLTLDYLSENLNEFNTFCEGCYNTMGDDYNE